MLESLLAGILLAGCIIILSIVDMRLSKSDETARADTPSEKLHRSKNSGFFDGENAYYSEAMNRVRSQGA
ncbi:hypothetical protein EU538_05670 [Candidatus Thorarchaeota archaeon]|nr:MAG: hypothetical protein EU538_05670 [Candidatus Thorarchaeota archaeon]